MILPPPPTLINLDKPLWHTPIESALSVFTEGQTRILKENSFKLQFCAITVLYHFQMAKTGSCHQSYLLRIPMYECNPIFDTEYMKNGLQFIHFLLYSVF
jgi:hypothetical protein